MRWNYYKLRQLSLLQIATGITKCDDYYKLRQYNCKGSLSLARSVGVGRREPWKQGRNNKSWRSEINERMNAAGDRNKLITLRLSNGSVT